MRRYLHALTMTADAANPPDDLPLFPGRQLPARVLRNPSVIYPLERDAARDAMASIGHEPIFSPPDLDEAVAALRREARRQATGRVAELLAQADELVAMRERRQEQEANELDANLPPPDTEAATPAARGWWQRLRQRG